MLWFFTLIVSIIFFAVLRAELLSIKSIIMSNQAEFDSQVANLNTKLDAVSSNVLAEKAEIEAFIAAHPDLDTSALEAVASRLDGIGVSVSDIFTAPEAPVEPAPEVAPVDEAPSV